jgi:hypothetical protein
LNEFLELCKIRKAGATVNAAKGCSRALPHAT